MRGVFIVIEGSDGTGKATQAQRLHAWLSAQGHAFVAFDFPQYDKPSAYFVKEYLNGAYGDLATVSPKRASLFFALDRFDASRQIRSALDAGNIVVANRYVASNMAHQGGRIPDSEREAYFAWNDELEYSILGIPKPDLNIILYIPPEKAQQLVDQKGHRDYVGGTKRDLHEADIDHLRKSSLVYKQLAQQFPNHFTLIDCMDGERLLSIDEVHERVIKHVKNALKLT